MSLPLAQLDLALVELIARFYLYLLPPAVLVVLLVVSRRGRRPAGEAERLIERARTIRWIGLLNYGLALRGVLLTVPEFAGYFRFGAFPSLMIVNVAWPLLTAALHLPIGWGVRGLRRWARWAEIVFGSILSLFGLLLLRWLWAHEASIDVAEWPDIAVSKALPVWMLLVMVWPRTGRVFASRDHVEATSEPPARPSPVSLITLGFLVVLGAVVGVSALDWMIRIGAAVVGVRETL